MLRIGLAVSAQHGPGVQCHPNVYLLPDDVPILVALARLMSGNEVQRHVVPRLL